MAGYTTCRFSRRDTCGFSSKVKQVDTFSLFSGHIKRLLTLDAKGDGQAYGFYM